RTSGLALPARILVISDSKWSMAFLICFFASSIKVLRSSGIDQGFIRANLIKLALTAKHCGKFAAGAPAGGAGWRTADFAVRLAPKFATWHHYRIPPPRSAGTASAWFTRYRAGTPAAPSAAPI